MRKILGIFLAGVMIVGAGGTALAATDTSTVNVTVAAIDVLQVTDGGTISLNQVSGNDITGDPDNTATLSYTHNFSTNRMITAQVLEGGMPAGTQDISLTVAVTGGAGEVTLVSGGTRNMNPLAVWNNIPRGAISNAAVTYAAAATASGTEAGSYTFTVTFTSTDQS
jgi:hypothetical protein